MKAFVLEEGTVERVEVVSGNPVLGKSAGEALRKWKFGKRVVDREAGEIRGVARQRPGKAASGITGRRQRPQRTGKGHGGRCAFAIDGKRIQHRREADSP